MSLNLSRYRNDMVNPLDMLSRELLKSFYGQGTPPVNQVAHDPNNDHGRALAAKQAAARLQWGDASSSEERRARVAGKQAKISSDYDAASLTLPAAEAPYADHARYWEARMHNLGCKTSGYHSCVLPPDLTIRAVDDFQMNMHSHTLPGSGKYCPIPVLPSAPTLEAFADRLWATPFIFRFPLGRHPFRFDELLKELANSHGAVDFIDADFGSVFTRTKAERRTCVARSTEVMRHVWAGIAEPEDGAFTQLTCHGGNSRCLDEKKGDCVDLLVPVEGNDGTAKQRRRTIGFGMSGIQNGEQQVKFMSYLGPSQSQESLTDYNISKHLWRRSAFALGDLAAWGGHSMLKPTYKAERVFFGTPGMRTPHHIDAVPQILSQFNGTKYAFMSSGGGIMHGRNKQQAKYLAEFGVHAEATLGYVGPLQIEAARRSNSTDFVAGCLLHPGDALYMPPWTFHDIFTVTPSISSGTRFDMAKMMHTGHPVRRWKHSTLQERSHWGIPKAQPQDARHL